ncbi:MAG: NYN domain-containing protein [Candidatus Hermodarchaeota archaeon]
MDRIAIFIDNSNIFKGFRKFNIKVDYERLKQVITRERELQNIFLYEGAIYPLSPEKKKWYKALSKNSGYIINTSFDKIVLNDAIEKKVDIKIAIDMISLAYEDAYDTAVLVSGDGDFLPLVKKIKTLGKDFELWAFNYSLANTLREEVDQSKIFYLDDVLDKIEI